MSEKKTNMTINEKLKNLVENYEITNITKFLKGDAHNFHSTTFYLQCNEMEDC